MRRVAVVLASAAALVMPAAPAFATVHPLSCSELSSAPAGTAAATQDPPGLTPGGPDRSSATVAQPVVSVFTNAGADAAVKPEGC
jgi:hypothetical protein